MSQISKLLFCLIVLVVTPVSAVAQNAPGNYYQRDRNISVQERPKPEYETPGIRAGSFVLEPEIVIATTYDSNINNFENGGNDDLIVSLNPAVNLRSDWNVHSLELSADLDTHQFTNSGDESYTDWGVAGEARIDIQRGTHIRTGASYGNLNESRLSAGVAQISRDRVALDRAEVFVAGYHEAGRIRIQPSIGFRDVDFDDAELLDGSIADQDFRDREDYSAGLRTDYALSDDTSIFVNVEAEKQNYAETNLAFSRDLEVVSVRAGADFDISAATRGQISAGFLSGEYDDNMRDGFSGLSLDGSLEWFATPLITVSLDGRRAVEATGLLESSSRIDTGIGVRADYEMRRNIVLSAGARYNDENYRDIDRNDGRLGLFAGSELLMNRSVSFTVEASYDELSSNGDAQQRDFDRASLMVGVRLRR